MINESPPFKGLHIRIPIIIPVKGKGFINQGSGLTCSTGAPQEKCSRALSQCPIAQDNAGGARTSGNNVEAQI